MKVDKRSLWLGVGFGLLSTAIAGMVIRELFGVPDPCSAVRIANATVGFAIIAFFTMRKSE